MIKNGMRRFLGDYFWYRGIIFILSLCIVTISHAQQLAFPGAEGYGRFTTGGRDGRVIEVINLNDWGAGSLRAAIEASGKRTVVFRVSGTIALNSPLRIYNGNITIAGQTAPGDGICVRNYEVSVDADNVIIRYIRFRLGDEKGVESDALGGRSHKNIIIDHCTVSWSVDECLSFYDNRNLTVQWCLISESLRNSVHSKGPHGYGGIWGGYDCSFHHNLLAHHSSRNPRFNGVDPAPAENVDFRNNVIYNWGFNSAYGGEGGKINMIANYYKYGPATGPKDRIVEPSDPTGQWYIADNYVFGFPNVTADNWAGGVQGSYWYKVRIYSPHPFAPVLTHTAENAYLVVLTDAGASLPKRDSLDARIVWEVRNQTALYGGAYTGAGTGIIDSQTDVGGWPTLHSALAPTDTDHDGMPDDWETANGLNLSDPDDKNGDLDGDGYTNLEEYLNSLCIRGDFILAPASLTAAVISPSQIDLVWQENAENETGFSIERSQNDTSSFVEIVTVAANDTSYSDTGLSPVTTYYYRVRAYNDKIFSIYTNTAYAKTIYADGSPLEAANPSPADSATDVSIISILRWTAGAAATSHDVYFGATNPPEFQGNQTSTEFDPHGLMDSTTYYWRIDEVNDVGTTTGPVWRFITESLIPALAAYWPFDRGMGSLALDATGNRNHGYLKNMQSTNWVEGFSDNALEFDGQDDYILVYHNDFIDFHIRGFTLSFWVQQKDNTITASYISKRIYDAGKWSKGYEIYHDANGKVRFVVADDFTESSVEAPNSDFVTGDWVFVTAVRDRAANTLRLYANGVLKASSDDSTFNISQHGDLYIGTNAEQQHYHRGMLDEIRIYNYPLDTPEVMRLYSEYVTEVTDRPGPVHYQLALHSYPNPFNPATKIVYTVPNRNRVRLTLFNLLGQEIVRLVDEVKPAGEYMFVFDAANLNSGVYFSQLNVGNQSIKKKMLLMK